MLDTVQAISHSAGRSGLDDFALVLQTQRGDGASFTELVRRYHGRIFNTMYALVGDRDDADDLAQEIFVRAYQALAHFRGRSQFYTWLYRIGINCWKDWAKSPRNTRQRKDLWASIEDYDAPSEGGAGPIATDAEVENRELQDILEQALARLPARQRAAVVLREIDGLDYEGIARTLGCSVGTVKSRLFRARARLRKLWETRYRSDWTGAL